MKRIAIAALAAVTLAGPLAMTASAEPYGQSNSQYHQGRGGDDRRDNDRGDNDRRGYNDGRYNDGRGDQHGNWNNNGWNQGRGDFQNHRQWRRGDRMSSYYQNSYRGVDYRYAHLRAPPRGYRYVQDDRGDTLLVGIATGVILSILANQQY